MNATAKMTGTRTLLIVVIMRPPTPDTVVIGAAEETRGSTNAVSVTEVMASAFFIS
jgi:hypothetical protein